MGTDYKHIRCHIPRTLLVAVADALTFKVANLSWFVGRVDTCAVSHAAPSVQRLRRQWLRLSRPQAEMAAASTLSQCQRLCQRLRLRPYRRRRQLALEV